MCKTNYDVIIGLEIHAKLMLDSKFFCKCKSQYTNKKNINTCYICKGFPGTLPIINKKAIELAIKLGIALNCKINKEVIFDRKSYFYHDLPKGFQITQNKKPICQNGYLEIYKNKIEIERIHLEEDVARSIYKQDDEIFIDYNRAGIALIEIVTEPCITSASLAKKFVEELGLILKYLEICDMKMEEGSLRIDTNISLRESKSNKNFEKVEIKNLSSLRSLTRAIDYEYKYQKNILDKGNKILKQTKKFDEKLGKTVIMRNKETPKDYYYIKEYNIKPIIISEEKIKKIKNNLKKLTIEREKKYINEYNLKEFYAKSLIKNKFVALFFEKCLEFYYNPEILSKFIINELLRYKEKDMKITPKDFSEIVKLFSENKITKEGARESIKELNLKKESLESIIDKYKINSNKKYNLENIILNVIENNEKALSDYILGNEKIFHFFVGECNKELKNSVSFNILKEELEKELKNYKKKLL